jgi:hypothetical protein
LSLTLVDKIYYDPDFEEKYFDEYVYDENGWIVVDRWIDNGRKIGDKRRQKIGGYVALVQDDNYLVFKLSQISRQPGRSTINAKYFDNSIAAYPFAWLS